MKKYQNTLDKFLPLGFIIILLLLWEVGVDFFNIPSWKLPSPTLITKTLFTSMPDMYEHIKATLVECVIGFTSAILIAFVIAFIMDAIPMIKRALYPILITTQTIPIISVAPLFIIWLGFGMTPKIIVVQLVCFFPIVISLLGGLASADDDLINLMKSMGAGNLQTFFIVKLPAALPGFFSGLKISATYSVMGAVIGEWLGAEKGLGYYMILAQKSFRADRVFATIMVITLLSLTIFKIVDFTEKVLIPWKNLS